MSAADGTSPDGARLEVWAGDNLLVFDGAVLELFGHPASPSARWHVRALELDVGEPDRKGRRSLTIRATARYSGAHGIEIAPEDWSQVDPLLDRVLAAMP